MKRIGSVTGALICLCLSACLAAEAESKPLFTILYTAEAHAALLPCDCPLQPLGGVARRATLIKRFRERGPVLLLDGGGWAAGGLYDEDSDGEPERDALRTRLMRDAMRVMKYDTSALGQNDVLAIKSAQETPADFHKGTRNIGGKRVDVSVWNEPGIDIFGAIEVMRILPCQLHPPIENGFAARLSRLGEMENETFAKEKNCDDLILNSGRKATQRTDWRVGSTTLVNFDYQARNLIVIEVFPAPPGSGQRYEFRTRLEPLGKEIPDDPEIVKLLEPHLAALKKKGKKRIEIEYWTMPDCPYCKLARPELQKLAHDLGDRVSIVPHWVVEKRGNELSSLHGDDELNEARVQAVIAKYYPEKIWAWLEWRAEHRDPWSAGRRETGASCRSHRTGAERERGRCAAAGGL